MTASVLALLELLASCNDDARVVRQDVPDAHVSDDAGSSSPDTFATATVKIDAVADAVAGPGGAVNGMGTWRATHTGVDFELSFFGCSGMAPFPIEIIEAGDCSATSLQAATWNEGRGAGIPSIGCTGTASGMGMLRYTRSADRDGAWTIGGPSRSNILGRALLIRDPVTMAPLACGVIARGDDHVRVPPPPPDQPPSVQLRAQLAGTCLLGTVVGAEPGCPDPEAVVACASEHCDLGSCIASCTDYTDCLAKDEDTCQSMFTCPQSAECAGCQADMWTCVLGYCIEDVSCVPKISADGPCRKLESCCALQGENAAGCLTVVQLIENLGGDGSCIGSMNDWDVLSHMHVPCDFME